MLAATSAAIAAAKAEREVIVELVCSLTAQIQSSPRLGFRLRVAQLKLAAVEAWLVELEEAARVEETQLSEDDEAAIVIGVVLAAGDRDEVDQVRKQLRAMSAAELLASVDATRAARETLASAGTVMAICDRRDHDTALRIADHVAAERGIALPMVPAVPTRAKERGQEL